MRVFASFLGVSSSFLRHRLSPPFQYKNSLHADDAVADGTHACRTRRLDSAHWR
jgi:hypothetical protein